EGRRHCSSWPELDVARQAKGTVTRLRLDRRCFPLMEGVGLRRETTWARCRSVKHVFSRYELAIECRELLHPAPVFPHCVLPHWSVSFSSLSTTSFGASASMSLKAPAAAWRWSGVSSTRA